jgi:phosphotransferase system enzyme I (PtsI)
VRKLRGIPASEGIAIGPAFVYRPEKPKFERRQVEDVEAELERFQRALEGSKEQLSEIHAKAKEEAGEDTARIFEAHLLFLEDPALLERVHSKIKDKKLNAEAAVAEMVEEFAFIFEAMEDEYMRARSADVQDVGQRLLRNLLGLSEKSLDELTSPVIIVAENLAPSDTAQMDKSLVLGFCTAAGGTTSHTAIMARILGIPAVVGVGGELLSIKSGPRLVVDGKEGGVVVEPSEEMVVEYWERQHKFRAKREEALALAQVPAVTRDGHRVEVVANIGDVNSTRIALEYGAEGVGLLRTEFLYLDRASLPSEEEQYTAYRAIADIMGQRSLIIRTLDIGGDKQLPYLDFGDELNPFLGWRAIRLCLDYVDLFKTQLRAILRASHERNVKIMFPMIADVEEVRQAKKILAEVMAKLKASGIPFAPDMEVGIMVETPAAALAADILAEEVDFFSIGTNDLIQYTMACDRTNERVSYLYKPLHPAILRLIKGVIEAAHKAGKWVGMCGEMTGEALAIPILLGLGLDEFSMNATAIPRVKSIIRALRLDRARRMASYVLGLKTEAEVQAYAKGLKYTNSGDGEKLF